MNKLNQVVTCLTGAGLLLSSCVSIQKIPVPLGAENGIELPAKKLPLTESQKQTWGHADLASDTIPGMSVQKAYDFLKNKKPQSVVVAVADSGIDIKHEDLKDVLWSNPKEIPGNNKDDDKNGFIDDIYGWNFLGDVYDENLEITRIVKKHQEDFEGKNIADISADKKEDFKNYVELKGIFDSKLEEAKKGKDNYSFYQNTFKVAHQSAQDLTGKKDYTLADLKALKEVPESIDKQIDLAKRVMADGSSLVEQMESIQKGVDYFTAQVNAHYNLDFNPRNILNNDGYTMNVTSYGDANVGHHQDDEIHGTHVAGIILETNQNGIGVDGVTKFAKLMSVRVVPNGDEYDKDVALGIRYAVDNGAKVINTSFGKSYSPNKEWVFDAIKYAEKNDVLIVNAAGNDAQNIDEDPVYPNDSNDLVNELSANVLTVGAMGSSYDENLLATFSNYGKINVDVFAPGVKIYATVPNNKYDYLSGTSMAAPSTAGVAALLRAYYPKFSAAQIKQIIMNSGTKIDFKVLKPGSKTEKVSLSELCVSGRIVNAYQAVQMAERMLKNR